jgi:hypothetical protein
VLRALHDQIVNIQDKAVKHTRASPCTGFTQCLLNETQTRQQPTATQQIHRRKASVYAVLFPRAGVFLIIYYCRENTAIAAYGGHKEGDNHISHNVTVTRKHPSRPRPH